MTRLVLFVAAITAIWITAAAHTPSRHERSIYRHKHSHYYRTKGRRTE